MHLKIEKSLTGRKQLTSPNFMMDQIGMRLHSRLKDDNIILYIFTNITELKKREQELKITI